MKDTEAIYIFLDAIIWWEGYQTGEPITMEKRNEAHDEAVRRYVSQPAVEADAKKCVNCGAVLETYCKNCFNSGGKNRTA